MEEDGEVSQNHSHITGELQAMLEDGDEFLPDGEIKEEMVVEVMQELWKEINSCYSDHYNCNISTSPPQASFPMATSSSSLVLVGGDNESCGSTFSDSASTVMAGVGMGPARMFSGQEVVVPAVVVSGAAVVEGRKCCMQQGGRVEMDGCDGGEFDDVWLDRVLSVGPREFEERT